MAGVITLIVGPGGFGKTWRLGALADEHGGPVERIRGSALEQETPLGALRHLVEVATDDHHAVAAALADRLDPDALLLVDDAQLLDDLSLAAVGALAQLGPSIAAAHRPTSRSGVVALDAALAASGKVERLAQLDEAGVGALVAELTGRPADSELVASMHVATGGVPALVAALAAGAAAADVLPALVEAELVRLGPAVSAVAQVATLAPELPDDVLADAVGSDATSVRDAFDVLAAGGLLDPEQGELWPCVAEASRSLLTSARRRELHSRLASAVLGRGGEIADAADHLLRTGATGEDAANLFIRAGDEIRFRDPAAAIDWYSEAATAGTLTTAGQVGLVEAEAFAGQAVTVSVAPPDLSSSERARLLAVRAVDEAREGRPGRAAELFAAIAADDVDHPSISSQAALMFAATLRSATVPVGQSPPVSESDAAHDPLDSIAEVAYRTATACRSHIDDPSGSGERFVDAAEAFERIEPTFLAPDSPHAIGALHLAASGDLAGAEILIGRATRLEPGGPVLRNRHRLLHGWIQMRRGLYELPVAVVRDPGDCHDGRDRLLLASLVAGLARRNGDIARLRDAWATAEPLLLAGVGDLFHLEVTGELVLAAARLRKLERAEPAIELLEALTGDTASSAWAVPHAWLQVLLGVETDDASATAAAAARLSAAAVANRHQDQALVQAALVWTTIVGVAADPGSDWPDEVEAAASALGSRGLPWEASRLAGQAAIRVAEPTVARRLLEQARQLHRSADSTPSDVLSDAGLSERELEIARYVVDGLTHREIGAQLYISPKTVEHHVARIRRKIQAGSRAEMLATLRDLVPAS